MQPSPGSGTNFDVALSENNQQSRDQHQNDQQNGPEDKKPIVAPHATMAVPHRSG
jgi:hypothetical protein